MHALINLMHHARMHGLSMQYTHPTKAAGREAALRAEEGGIQRHYCFR